MVENSSDGSGVKVYGYRWVVLGVFMFINLTIQVLWICFAPISGLAAEHYGVSDMDIGILAMVFMVVYIIVFIPASLIIDKFGFQKGVGLGALLLGVFGLLRGLLSYDYHLVLACTIGVALAQPLLLNSYTTLAAKWFPIQERASASGLAMAANFIGTAIGLMLTPYLTDSYGIGAMQTIYGVLAAASSILFLALARETPPTPASPPGYEERALMLDGLKMMVKMRDFWICMFVFFVGFGVFNGLATWIENIVRPKQMSEGQAGMIGGLLLIGGILGAFVIPTLSDKFARRKPFMLAGMILATPGLIGFTYSDSYPMLLASAAVLGFFMMGLGPIGYQNAAEITYPAPEGTSNGLLVLAGQISVVFIFGMEAMNNAFGSFKPSLLVGVAMMAGNCILIALVKESKLIGQLSE